MRGIPSPATIYEMIGGADTIRELVTHFYKYVAQDPDLSPIFPDDFTEVREKQYAFLTQFFGGPQLYTQTYGPPKLRARHLPFPVTPRRAKAWLRCMERAMDDTGIQGDVRQFMLQRLTLTAHHMVNTPDEEAEGNPGKGG
jgi:hemoglobin